MIYPSTFHIRSSISYQLHLNTAPEFQWTTWIYVSACKMWSPHFHPQWMILENLNLYNTTFPMYGQKSVQGGTSINNSAQLSNVMRWRCPVWKSKVGWSLFVSVPYRQTNQIWDAPTTQRFMCVFVCKDSKCSLTNCHWLSQYFTKMYANVNPSIWESYKKYMYCTHMMHTCI